MRRAGATLRVWIQAALRGEHAAAAVAGSCAVFLALALAGTVIWLNGGTAFWVDFFFKQIGGPLLVVYAMVEMIAVGSVPQWFAPGEPMRGPWRLLFAAGMTHAASMVFRHWLGEPIASNPLVLKPDAEGWMQLCREFGRVLGGTVYLALLAAGLGAALRVHARLGLLRPPGAAGWAAFALAGGLFAYTLRSLVYWLGVPGVRTSAFWWLGWVTDPLLGLLLVMSMLLMRASAPLAGGLLGRPWRSYFWALLLTCLGSLCVGLGNAELVPAARLWPSWFLWHPAGALFALAPLWQLQAISAPALAQRREARRNAAC